MEEYAHYEVKILELPDHMMTIDKAKRYMLLFLWCCTGDQRITAPDGSARRRLTFQRNANLPHIRKLMQLEEKCGPLAEAIAGMYPSGQQADGGKRAMYLDALHQLHAKMLLAAYDPDSLPYNAFDD